MRRTDTDPNTFCQRNSEIRRLRSLPAEQRPTLAELAERFAVSRERIRQIEGGIKHRDSGDRCYPGGIVLRPQGQGRFDVLRQVDGRGLLERLGTVLGGRGRWSFERRGSVVMRAKTVHALCALIAGSCFVARSCAPAKVTSN